MTFMIINMLRHAPWFARQAISLFYCHIILSCPLHRRWGTRPILPLGTCRSRIRGARARRRQDRPARGGAVARRPRPAGRPAAQARQSLGLSRPPGGHPHAQHRRRLVHAPGARRARRREAARSAPLLRLARARARRKPADDRPAARPQPAGDDGAIRPSRARFDPRGRRPGRRQHRRRHPGRGSAAPARRCPSSFRPERRRREGEKPPCPWGQGFSTPPCCARLRSK